jgi:hypothetical protein
LEKDLFFSQKKSILDYLITQDFRILRNLFRFVFKLFMEIKFENADFKLAPFEKLIIIQLLKKKRFVSKETIIFNSDFFNKINKANLQKKKEDCLKFIFNKAISHLKTQFKNQNKSQILKKDQLNIKFYEHHFGKISEIYKIPIESFYDYSLYNKTKNKLISKSISKQYLEKIKLNPVFVKQIISYLNNDFIDWFYTFNSKKIKRKIFQWENLLTDFGFEEGLKIIVNRINSRNNKLFWTLNETHSAMKIALNCLSST